MASSLVMLKLIAFLAITNGFHVETLTKTWWDADAYCQTKYGTHLITVTDSTMNDNIKNAMASIVERAWIGYYDTQNEGDFKWIGYNQSSFTDWGGSQPDNGGGKVEDCCQIYLGYGPPGYWNDVKCSYLMPFVCAEPGDYPTKTPSLPPTKNPTSDPIANPTSNPTTKGPTINPTSSPTENPTIMPTGSTTLNEMKSIDDGSSCDNLADSYDLIYEISLNECINLCQHMAESCRMINFYYYFKSHNDSRCYIFDDICEVVSNDNHGMNHTTMYYKTYRDSCTDYPHDWVDKIGDNCDIYSTYNWCEDGVVLTNENEFDALADKRYNLAALDACCECGGGIKIKNGVAFSVDQYWNEPSDDILCSFTPHSFEETRSSLRKWDNLVLYELCAYLSEVDCAFLVDSQFDSSDHPYSIHLCSGSEPHTPFPFIIEFLTHDAYVNLLWFSLDASYYSTNINVIYSNYSQCVHHILHDNDINDTSHGIHPCYTED
eukprot:904454_1